MNRRGVVRILKEAKALLQKRGGWTQGTSARFRNGLPACHDDLHAVSFCAYGAIDAARYRLGGVGRMWWDHRCRAARLFEDVVGTPDAHVWNDKKGRRKREVLAAFDGAIKAAEGRRR